MHERYIVDRVSGSTSFEILNDGSPSRLRPLPPDPSRHGAAQAVRADLQLLRRRGLRRPAVRPARGLRRAGAQRIAGPDRGDPPRSLSRPGQSRCAGHAALSAAGRRHELAGGVSAGIPGQDARAGRLHLRRRLGPPGTRATSPTPRASRSISTEPDLPHRGLPVTMRDPLGNDTTIAYDRPYHLLPVQVTDAVGLTTSAEYDYRVLQPRMVTDANGNRRAVTLQPLGTGHRHRRDGEGRRAGRRHARGARQPPGVRLLRLR